VASEANPLECGIMSTAPEPAPIPPPAPTVHEAEPAPGPSGAVLYGAELDFARAVARRQSGLDVVVGGRDGNANPRGGRPAARRAYRSEAAVGRPSRPQPPEAHAGPLALPHYHQHSRNPGGHLFYETDKRKARKKP